MEIPNIVLIELQRTISVQSEVNYCIRELKVSSWIVRVLNKCRVKVSAALLCVSKGQGKGVCSVVFMCEFNNKVSELLRVCLSECKGKVSKQTIVYAVCLCVSVVGQGEGV